MVISTSGAREHWKTSIITHTGCIQEILRDPEVTIGIFSHTKGVAKKILASIKNDLENNEILKSVFPDILYKNPKKDSPIWTLEKFTVKRNSNTREATCEAWGVVDGQPTGAHFKLRVYDDLVTAESVNTPEQIEKTTEMLSLSDNLGSEGGRVRFIGTRYSLGDTYQHMIEKGQVKVRIHKATDNGLVTGKPVFFSQAYWESKVASQTMATLSCQMLQNPNAGSQAMFDPFRLMTYDTRPTMLNIYILVDPARMKKKGSDKTAMAVIGVDSGFNKFLLDGYHHRMALSEKWDNLKALYKRWYAAPGVGSCEVGYEVYGAQSDTDYFAEQMERENFFFTIRELKGTASKQDRMARIEPDVRMRRFFVSALIKEEGSYKQIKMAKDPRTDEFSVARSTLSASQLTANGAKLKSAFAAKPLLRVNEDNKPYDVTMDFIDQLKQAPNNSAHDDLIDAVSRIYDMDVVAPRALPSSGRLTPPTFD